MDAELKCSKCGGRMTEGSVLQKLDGLMVPLSTWVEGQVERTLLGSTKTPEEKTRTITAFCCSGCGLLEFYAR
jgi:predicted nucleic-acid-binding Zn-ribbon protein